jgi:hypothetical protein
MKYCFLHFLLLIIALAGCSEQPDGDMAKISQPEDVNVQSTGTIYAIDTATSIVTWIGSNPTGRHNGIIKFKKGSINVIKSDSLNRETQERVSYFNIGNVELTIDLHTIDILDLKHDRKEYTELLNFLKSEDFFHVEKFPEAFFELTAIEDLKKDTLDSEENEFNTIDPTHTIRGNLTIKGIKKGIEFPARLDLINLKLEASAKFNIDRTIWNINNLDDNDPAAKTRDRLINPIVNVGFEIIAYP